jgi:preprotein translocase subunit YajC
MLISDAFAQAAAPAQSDGGGFMTLLPLIGIFVIFYLLLIRPQSKRAKEQKLMIAALKRGDEIITSGGELGLITNVSESYVILEIAPSVEVTVAKSAITTLLPKGTLKSITPAKGAKLRKSNKSQTNNVAQEDKKETEAEAEPEEVKAKTKTKPKPKPKAKAKTKETEKDDTSEDNDSDDTTKKDDKN